MTLDASSQLDKRVGRKVDPLVGRSVPPSVGLSVSGSRFHQEREISIFDQMTVSGGLLSQLDSRYILVFLGEGMSVHWPVSP